MMNMLAFGIGPQELLIFGAILALLFGANRLPSLMRNLGRSATEFKRGMREEIDDPLTPPHNIDASDDADQQRIPQ